MSSLPSKEGVEKVRAAIRDWRFLTKRIAEVEKIVSELPKLKEEAREKHREVIACMNGMDVAANGNMGWENRVMWFLDELEKQAAGDPL